MEWIYRRTEDDLGIPIGQCPDEVKWAIFLESEARMRPVDLLTHRFAAVDDDPLFGYREMLRAHGLPEAMVIPIFIRDTFVVVAAAFPKGDYASQTDRVLHEIYQLIVTIFDRFPTLTKWPDESRLSRREAEVLQHTAAGLNEAEIAKTLKISKHTVRKHVENCNKETRCAQQTPCCEHWVERARNQLEDFARRFCLIASDMVVLDSYVLCLDGGTFVDDVGDGAHPMQ